MSQPRQNKVIGYCLPIVAIIISIMSLFISYFGYQVSESSFKLGLVPILKAKLIVERDKKLYSLSLLNDGPNDIYEIKVQLVRRLISQKYEPLGTLRSRNTWNQVNYLKKNESRAFNISNDEIERAFEGENMKFEDSVKPIGSTFTFLISFRREPDRKIYREAKTIFFFRDSQTRQPIDFDPDEFRDLPWKNAAKKLEDIDQDFDF